MKVLYFLLSHVRNMRTYCDYEEIYLKILMDLRVFGVPEYEIKRTFRMPIFFMQRQRDR